MVSPYGTQVLAALLIDEAVRRGWNATLFTASYRSDSTWATFLQERNVKVVHPHFWFMTRRHWPHRIVSRRLWKMANRESPAVIWSPDNDPLTCRCLESRPANGSPPFFVHDPNEATSKCPNYPALWFEVCHRVDGLSVHGKRQAVGARTHYKLEKPIEVVWPSSFAPQGSSRAVYGQGPVRFGQFGRLHSQKGSLFTVAAFSRLVEQGLHAELHFFGDGPLEGTTKELTDSLGLSDHVHFHGGYDWTELDSLISQIDVGLMPSIYEGFGLVMLELMSRGRPVISSDVGSSKEVLEQLGGGYVVPRADTNELAKAMEQFCVKADLVHRMGTCAQGVWSEHFTPRAMFDRYLKFWRSCGATV